MPTRPCRTCMQPVDVEADTAPADVRCAKHTDRADYLTGQVRTAEKTAPATPKKRAPARRKD